MAGTEATLGRGPARTWLAVSGAALAVGLVYLAIFAVPPLITTFVDDLGLSHAEAGALMSVCLAGFLVASLASGRLARRYGPIPVVVGGLVLCGVATVCLPLAENLPLWLLCRAAVGIGGGLIYAPGVTFLIALLPASRANVGVGVFLCGLSIGATVAFFSTRLIAEALDWRWPFWIFGVVVLVGSAAVAFVSGPLSPAARRDGPRGSPTRMVLGSRPFQLLLASLFGALFVAYGVFTWIPPYLDESAGFSAARVSLASALVTLSTIPATFGAGWLADRLGKPLAVAATALTLPLLLAVFALTAAPAFGAATAVSIVAAMGVSGGLVPLYALPPLLFGPIAGGTASGIAAASAMGGAVASTYIGGWIVGDGSGYGAAFAAFTAAAAVTALLLVPLVGASLRRAKAATAETSL